MAGWNPELEKELEQLMTLPAPTEREAHDAVTFTVMPQRIGRDLDPDPFDVALPVHYRPTARVLAERISKHIRLMLLSDNYEVRVDMAKGTFTINHGRFGRGRFDYKKTGD